MWGRVVDTNGLLTIIALVLAVYAILPKERQRELVLRFRTFDLLLAVTGLVITHALQYYSFLRKILPLGEWKDTEFAAYSLSEQSLSYLIILLVSLILILRMSRFRLRPSGLAAFKNLVDAEIGGKDFSSLATVVEDHIKALVDISRGRFFRSNFHRLLGPPSFFDSIENRKRLNVPRQLRWIVDFVPSGKAAESLASQILTTILSNKPFAVWCSENRPYVALSILKLEASIGGPFIENFFQAQLGDSSSVLYSELKNNQNMARGHRYQFPESNRILSQVLGDPAEAERVQIWRPIGEKMIAYLSELGKHPEQDDYNLPLEDYMDNQRYESPLSAGIFFFDLMVSEAIHKGIKWHMWLYYMTHVTDRICDNYSPRSEKIDLTREFPTKYSFVLYEITRALRSWISTLEELPVVQQNINLASTAADHENGNPIKSSMIALGQHIHSVITCARIPIRFKNDLAEQAFSQYVELNKMQNGGRYAEAFLAILLVGGTYEHENDAPYLGALIAAAIDWDDVLFNENGARELLKSLVSEFQRRYDRERLRDYVDFENTANGIRILRDGGGKIDIEIVAAQ